MDADTLVSGSRNFLRDFPLFFEVDTGPLDVSTVRLPHPLVPLNMLQVVTHNGTDPPVPVPATDIQLDERNGLLKFLTTDYFGKRVLIAGYHFNWFLDSDLGFHAGRTLTDVAYGQTVDSMDDFSPIEMDTIVMGTVVSALWSLATELALDIDVSTPEGMYIPARQRYAQVMQMHASWAEQFKGRMEHLNLGTGRLEQFWLRRTAYLTNRLVPLYKQREFDDHTPPERLFPPIPSGIGGAEENVRRNPDAVWTVEEIARYGQDIDWRTLGTWG